MVEEKGRRGPEERNLILTTRIRAKKRINVKNSRRGRFSVVKRLSREISGEMLIDRGVKIGRVIVIMSSRVSKVVKKREIGWVREIG